MTLKKIIRKLKLKFYDTNQNIPKDLSDLEYGVSVTDACMGWDDTEKTLRSLASSVRTVLSQR